MAMTRPSDRTQDLLRQCIDSCHACHRTCLETVNHCLGRGGIHAEKAHVRALLDCAAMCQLSSDLMLRESELAHRLCELSAEACLLCADSCVRVDPDDDVMRHCAQVCRGCAESCRLMATV